MSKLFGVGAKPLPSHDTHTHDTQSAHGAHDTHAIDVDIHAGHDHEIDVGQIAVDVLDLAEEIIIVAPVAGVDPAEIDIALSRNILTLSGERKHTPIYLDAKRMLVEECYYGPFSRSIILPENLAFNKIKATVDHNTIMIHVPKITFFSKSIKIGE
jgi:HSP20 family molecular chaperone IbpA